MTGQAGDSARLNVTDFSPSDDGTNLLRDSYERNSLQRRPDVTKVLLWTLWR
jgi:hypothetical protein